MGEEKANYGDQTALGWNADGPHLSGALFSIIGQGPVGIARLAAKGADAGHRGGKDGFGVEFRTIQTRSMLNRIVSKRGFPFAWAINPYRGCEFGCRYCYARYTHEFLRPTRQARQGPHSDEADPLLFEREIYIKQQAAWLLRQELKQVGADEQIAIGTATDPWQPIERREQVTRSLLEVLAERSGLTVGIVTKSTLIERDIDLLLRISARNQLTACLTITTPDPQLARVLEPRAPRPDLRFRTVERLREAGLRVGILCSPLMPGITDTARELERMAVRTKKAGACFFSAQPLFLKPCSRPVFLRFIEEHFPQLLPAYEMRYRDRAFVSKAYSERVGALVKAVVRKHGLGERFPSTARKSVQPVWPVQGELWEGLQRRSA
jgi:DNA repair photolyase